MKGLRAEIYKPSRGDCSNSGISSKCSEVTIVGEGIPEIFEATDEAPAVKVVTRNLGGKYGSDYKHLEPVEKPTGNGWMYGGTLVCVSDSRFPSRYALKLHDRQEFTNYDQ